MPVDDLVVSQETVERLARELRMPSRPGKTTDVGYLLDAVRFEKGQELFGECVECPIV